jgi:hypothetical protein
MDGWGKDEEPRAKGCKGGKGERKRMKQKV